MKHIKLFENFELSEEDGYGDKKFHKEGSGDNINYFFKLENEEGERGLIVNMGKFSKFSTISEAKNSYAVISITEIDSNDLDQAVLDGGQYEENEEPIALRGEESTRFLEILKAVLDDYLENSPKTVKFYDEMQDKIETEDYLGKIDKFLVNFQDGGWNVQDIEPGKSLLIQK